MKQIKTKSRVSKFGEVFTGEKEVNAMLDLVQDQLQREDSTFLEPAFGTGNFLIEILNRKLKLIEKYKDNPIVYGRKLVALVSKIYGIELLKDNVEECRTRLLEKIKEAIPNSLRERAEYEPLMQSITFILQKNLICGNTLTCMDYEDKDIIFYEWKFVDDNNIQITSCSLKDMVQEKRQLNLFHTPSTYPLTHYLELCNLMLS